MNVCEQVENKFLFAGLFSIPDNGVQASRQDDLAFEFETLAEDEVQAALVSFDGYGIGHKYFT